MTDDTSVWHRAGLARLGLRSRIYLLLGSLLLVNLAGPVIMVWYAAMARDLYTVTADKDLAALYFSALEIGLTKRDFLRFLRVYFAAPLRQTLVGEAALLAHLRQESARLQARYLRKFAPAPQ